MTSERCIQRSTKRFERNLLISSPPPSLFLMLFQLSPFHTLFPGDAQCPSNRKIPVRCDWKKRPGVNDEMLQVSLTVFLRGRHIQKKGYAMIMI
ncbi:hypothetical protein CEXT_50981 [Caerostris extrusa]|uniref:Uncharacterized protein n=1 Tax=Caerostris extrusa TaxID=172846 RepID=A0AAV4RSK3_CAEEX|nr:hypothetical protein CEXT_50981 [Caerostris extrusa]